MHPLGLFDALATPMYDAFSADAGQRRALRRAIPSEIDLLARNPNTAANRAPSRGLDLPHGSTGSRSASSTRVLWKSVHGGSPTPPPPGPNAESRRRRGRGRVSRPHNPGACSGVPCATRTDKLGPRYPRWAIWVQFQFAYVVVLGGVGLLTLYVDLEQLGVLADPARRLRCCVLIENLVSLKLRPQAPAPRRPVAARRPHARDGGRRVARVRRRCRSTSCAIARGLVVLAHVVPISVFITLELDDTSFFPAFLIICVAARRSCCSTACCCASSRSSSSCRRCSRRPRCELPDDTELAAHGAAAERACSSRCRRSTSSPASSSPGFAAPHNSLDALGVGVLLAIARRVHDLARAVAAADALDRRAAAGPARRDRSASPRATSARACRCSAPTRPARSRVVQRHGRRAARSASGCARRSARSSTRCSPTACSREGTVLEGEEVEVTVLFLDIRGFTAFAERASAREVGRAAQRVLRAGRAGARRATAATRTSSSATGCSACSARPTARRPRRPLRRRGARDRAVVRETLRRRA